MPRGLLDWPGVLLGWIDQPLRAFLPDAIVLSFWALVSAAATMWVYRRFSNQDKLAALKPQIKAVQKKLSKYDGDFTGLKPLIAENFRLAGRQIGLALGPALLAGIPVLFVLVWVSNAYGVYLPGAGTPVQVRAVADSGTEAGAWRWRGVPAERLERPETPGSTWTVTWPGGNATAELVDAGNDVLLALPPAHASPVLHERRWWNALIANPAGYLAEENPAEAVYLELPYHEILPFGPGWVRGWPFLYFVLLIAGSLALKFLWRIH